jgi:hypothetical protein
MWIGKKKGKKFKYNSLLDDNSNSYFISQNYQWHKTWLTRMTRLKRIRSLVSWNRGTCKFHEIDTFYVKWTLHKFCGWSIFEDFRKIFYQDYFLYVDQAKTGLHLSDRVPSVWNRCHFKILKHAIVVVVHTQADQSVIRAYMNMCVIPGIWVPIFAVRNVTFPFHMVPSKWFLSTAMTLSSTNVMKNLIWTDVSSKVPNLSGVRMAVVQVNWMRAQQWTKLSNASAARN